MKNPLRSLVPVLLAAVLGLIHIPAAQAVAPVALTAVVSKQSAIPNVVLNWQVSSRGGLYVVFRDFQKLSAQNATTTYTDTRVNAGEKHTYYVASLSPPYMNSNVVTVQIPSALTLSTTAPTGLTISSRRMTTTTVPPVQLTWNAVAGASSYNVYRNGSLLQSGIITADFTDSSVAAGQTYAYAVTAVSPVSGIGIGGESAKSATVSITMPSLTPPPTPTAVTVKGVWDPDCVECAGMAMPEADLSWQASPGATSYEVYRNGTLLQASITQASFEDMTVTSGLTYTYTVAATGLGGDSSQSSPATVTAPNPPAVTIANNPPTGAALIAPTNLTSHTVWQGQPTDTLTWDAVPGAASYNVYQYNVPIAKGVTATTFTVPFTTWIGGVLYTVTAVDSMGMESLPSNPGYAFGGLDPNNLPSWAWPWVPTPVQRLTARPEWNNGAPRIALSWLRGLDRYDVYRDGKLIATDLWTLTYYDNSVQPGETHTYTVASLNHFARPGVESVMSSPVTVTALTSAPAPLATKVQVLPFGRRTTAPWSPSRPSPEPLTIASMMSASPVRSSTPEVLIRASRAK